MEMNNENGNIFSSAITVVAVNADVPTENAWETPPKSFLRVASPTWWRRVRILALMVMIITKHRLNVSQESSSLSP
jgi:hypothetical protein